MQRNDIARKIKMQVDNIELTNLVKFGEINLEDLSVEVPSFPKIITILSGTTKINPIVCTFKITRDSATYKFLKDWRSDRTIKDVTVIETDGTGTEYSRILLPECEAGQLKLPEFDATAPTYARAEITIYPVDVIQL